MGHVQQLLRDLGLPEGDRHDLPTSPHRFPDGAQYRVEIPSVEGPAALQAVLDTARSFGLTIHRVSQGSGIMLLTDADIREMGRLGREAGIEVCLFVGPRAPWEGSAIPLTPDGKIFGWRHLGMDQLTYGYNDVERACDLGIRSVLPADEGLIWLVNQARQRGLLPKNLIMKGSALMGVANPIGIKMLEDAGLNTINVASDISLARLAALRQVLSIPIDLYIEGPDGLGGFTRYHELAEIVRVGAPIYLKFGLRNAPNIYPSGIHLENAAISTGKERVRRAFIGMEHLARSGAQFSTSNTGVADLGIPE
ncbi:MAG: hypothetical protein IPK17_00595 [Chloroflexi bacterium]|uniref:hypothetical protein n=1 Tax=Candidatus Flexifilum breve TaxID=3140694 RepID=UPI0031357229|nr:hypothetical protein [Chloroflexota bacterium]